jgi:hypothetical protein
MAYLIVELLLSNVLPYCVPWMGRRDTSLDMAQQREYFTVFNQQQLLNELIAEIIR